MSLSATHPLKLEPVSDDDQSLRGYVDDVTKIMPSSVGALSNGEGACVGDETDRNDVSRRVMELCASPSVTSEPPPLMYNYTPLKVRIPEDHYDRKYASPPYLKEMYDVTVTPTDLDFRTVFRDVPSKQTMTPVVIVPVNERYYKKSGDVKGHLPSVPFSMADSDWSDHTPTGPRAHPHVPGRGGHGDRAPVGSSTCPPQLVKSDVTSPSSFVTSSTSLTAMSPAPDYDGVILVMQKSFNDLSAILMRVSADVVYTQFV